MVEYHVVAMSHIDMAFVMRREAQAEMLDILLERITGVLERRPELYFALEQAAHYRGLEQRRPDLFEKVKKLLAEGRLEFLGGMATTAETNFPNGECLIRNQGMGLQWVKEHLGVTPKVGWLVDTFGLNAQVPQIYKQFGFSHLYANRFGGNKRADRFWMEGLDGSRVLIIGRDLASSNVELDSQAFVFCRNWGDVDSLFEQADALASDGPKMVCYYIENEEIFSEYYTQLTEERGWTYSTFEKYSEELEAHGYDAPVLNEDMNPEFTGTFALRTPIKTENRKAENSLLMAELWDAMAGKENGAFRSDMEESWWKLFFCQFHDVFTGSHEDMTFQHVLDQLREVQENSRMIMDQTLVGDKNSTGMVLANSLPWQRTEWVDVTGNADVQELLSNGGQVPVVHRGENTYCLAQLPACGVQQIDAAEGQIGESCQPYSATEISNDTLRLVLSEKNIIERLEDNKGNVYLCDGAEFITAQEDVGGLQIENCGAELFASSGTVAIGKAVSDAMGSAITVRGEFPKLPWTSSENHLSWEAVFSLNKGEKGLRVRLTVDWQGMDTRIRVKLPSSMRGAAVYHEVPFGVVRREAYRELGTAKGEWPVQRFAVIEDGKKGVAFVNQGVAGVEQEGRTLATTLIRAYGKKANPWVHPTDVSCQNGKQVYEFLIVPYEGGWQDSEVIRAAHEWNQPVQVLKGTVGIPEGSMLSVDQSNIMLSAVKRAWDGTDETVIRFYESTGKASTANVKIAGLKAAYCSDMTEQKGAEIPCSDDTLALEFAPFEIKTIRVSRSL